MNLSRKSYAHPSEVTLTPTGDTFAQLEVGDGLLGSGHDRLLSGDSGQFLDRLFDVLFVGAEFAKTHVEDDLDELGAFHDGGVVELLHEFGNDLFLVKGSRVWRRPWPSGRLPNGSF